MLAFFSITKADQDESVVDDWMSEFDFFAKEKKDTTITLTFENTDSSTLNIDKRSSTQDQNTSHDEETQAAGQMFYKILSDQKNY